MTYTYNTTAADTGLLAAFAGIMLVVVLISLAVAIVSIIGMWKMFTKAGEEGWKSIIPIYNMITLCKIVGVSPWWILIVFVSGLLGIIPITSFRVSYGVPLIVKSVSFGLNSACKQTFIA